MLVFNKDRHQASQQTGETKTSKVGSLANELSYQCVLEDSEILGFLQRLIGFHNLMTWVEKEKIWVHHIFHAPLAHDQRTVIVVTVQVCIVVFVGPLPEPIVEFAGLEYISNVNIGVLPQDASDRI